MNLKADKTDTYTKAEVNTNLNLKADKTDTYTKAEVNTNLNLKADKTDTYTKAEINTNLNLKANISSPTFTGTPTAPTANAGTNTTQLATTNFVTNAVANLVDAAPNTLDTLNELAAAIGDDKNYSTTVTNLIANKQNQLHFGILDGSAVQMVTDAAAGNYARFSGSGDTAGLKGRTVTQVKTDLGVDTLKTKLDGIETGAEVNVQSDWDATSGKEKILNKPSLFSGSYTNLSDKPTLLQLGTTSTTALAGNTALFSGSYTNLSDKPTIPSGNQIIDWTADQDESITINKKNIPILNQDTTGNAKTATTAISNICRCCRRCRITCCALIPCRNGPC